MGIAEIVIEFLVVTLITILVDRMLSNKAALIALVVCLIVLGFMHRSRLKGVFRSHGYHQSQSQQSNGGPSTSENPSPAPSSESSPASPSPPKTTPKLGSKNSTIHIRVSPNTTVMLPDLRVVNNDLTTPTPVPDKPPTLLDLFLHDFPAIEKAENDLSADGFNLAMKQQIYLDFTGKSKYVGFYIPSSDPITGKKTYDMCMALIAEVQPAIDSLQEQHQMTGGSEDQRDTLPDLIFTRRVLIYHEDFLSITQKADIIRAYKAKHFEVQFLGEEYVTYETGLWLKAKQGQ